MGTRTIKDEKLSKDIKEKFNVSKTNFLTKGLERYLVIEITNDLEEDTYWKFISISNHIRKKYYKKCYTKSAGVNTCTLRLE